MARITTVVNVSDFEEAMRNRDGTPMDENLMRNVKSGAINEVIDENNVLYKIVSDDHTIDKFYMDALEALDKKHDKEVIKTLLQKPKTSVKIQNGASDEYWNLKEDKGIWKKIKKMFT